MEIPRIGRLRVSVNDICPLECLYCHRDGQLTKRRKQIGIEEYEGILEGLSHYGIDEVKLAAMEPLVYRDTPRLLKYVKEIGIKRSSVTTNGLLLEDRIDELVESGVDEVSVSLDTLDPKIFIELNKGPEKALEKTIRGILLLSRTKIPYKNINMTLTSYNAKDVEDIIGFCRDNSLDLRMIPLIKIYDEHKPLEPSKEDVSRLRKILKEDYPNSEKPATDTSRQAYTNYRSNKLEITVIDALCPDCEKCGIEYALRLTSDGKLKPCLISEVGEIDIATPFASGDMAEFNKRVVDAIILKKMGLIRYFGVSKDGFPKGFLPSDG